MLAVFRRWGMKDIMIQNKLYIERNKCKRSKSFGEIKVHVGHRVDGQHYDM